jgi:hypothetical protein
MAPIAATDTTVAATVAAVVPHCQVIIVYSQWAIILINLSTKWLPWNAGDKSAADLAAGVLLGRAASLDCWLQAWGLLQGDTVEQLVKNVLAGAAGRWVSLNVSKSSRCLLLS